MKFFADEVELFIDTNTLVATRQRRLHESRRPHRRRARRVRPRRRARARSTRRPASCRSARRSDRAQFGGQDPDVYFYGETIEKLGARQYRITRGGFTTCVQPTPRWELTSGSVTINLDDYAHRAQHGAARQGRAADLPAGHLLPDPGRRARHRLPAADLRHLDAARPVDQQRVLLGDRPQPGRDVRSTTGSRARARAWAASTATVERGLVAATCALYRFAQNETQFTEDGVATTLPASQSFQVAADGRRALGGACGTRARRLLLRHPDASSSITRTSTRRRSAAA